MAKKKKASKEVEVSEVNKVEERVYDFNRALEGETGFAGGFRKESIKESELTQEHLDLLYSELLKQYNFSPAKVKIEFVENCIKMIKENLDKGTILPDTEEDKELLNDVIKEEAHENTTKD